MGECHALGRRELPHTPPEASYGLGASAFRVADRAYREMPWRALPFDNRKGRI